MNEKKDSIELLRIVLFAMVIVIHVTGVGINTSEMGLIFGEANWNYAIAMRTLSSVAVGTFILITGYFMVEKENMKGKIKKLLEPFILYLPLYCMLNIHIEKNITSGITKTIEYGINLNGNLHHLWYIVVLCMMYLIIPFVNKTLKKCNKIQHGIIAILMLLITILIYYWKLPPIMFSNRILLFLTLYILGGYIAKHGTIVPKYLSVISFCILIMLTTIKILSIKEVEAQLIMFNQIVEYNSIWTILGTILIFNYFIQLNIKCKLIGFIGSMTYGAYIVHVFYICLLQYFIPFLNYTKSQYYFVYDLVFIFAVFVCSILTEALRKKIFRGRK